MGWCSSTRPGSRLGDPRSHGCCEWANPHSQRKTITLVTGLHTIGVVAPLVLDGPINSEWSGAYVGQVIVSEAKRGDVVILDYLSSHKRSNVRALIEEVGARLLFLLPYSP